VIAVLAPRASFFFFFHGRAEPGSELEAGGCPPAVPANDDAACSTAYLRRGRGGRSG